MEGVAEEVEMGAKLVVPALFGLELDGIEQGLVVGVGVVDFLVDVLTALLGLAHDGL